MARIAILVPFPEMVETAHRVLLQYPELDILCVEYHPTPEVAGRAVQLQAEGCELLICRGLQAMLIREAVDLPIVEMRVTSQELGTIVLQLKEEVGTPYPVIALVGFGNMLSDTSRFDELFGVRLRRYVGGSPEELERQAERAVNEGAEAMIGGEVVCRKARQLGIPAMPLPGEDESFHLALREAKRSAYAIDLQRRNNEEIYSMLNHAPNGMLQLDRAGIILRANAAAYDLLNREPGQLLGQPLQGALPQLGEPILDRVLKEGEEAYTSIRMRDAAGRIIIVNASPITMNGKTEGAFLTLQEDSRVIEMEAELRRELHRQGHTASYQFRLMVAQAEETKKMIAQAKKIARFPAPVLITGEAGVGKSAMAQCIHNESLRRENGFASIDCSGWLPETVDTMLFGTYGSRKDTPDCLVRLAENGTLYISHVEALQMESQYKLLCLIHGTFLHTGSTQPSVANVRVIASTDGNLITRVEDGTFRQDLYYALSVLTLEMLPLRSRREDISGWVDRYLRVWQKQYKRTVHLTDGARQLLTEYSWPGNLDQLNSVCERTVLLAPGRNIDEAFLRRLLEETSPQIRKGTQKVVLYRDPEGEAVAEALRRNQGNREKAAAELGISKTTLWRRMQKYGIGKDFTY